MAITAADARQLARVILTAYFEDISTIAMILRPLRIEWPTIDWIAELTAIASTWQPFLDSGLSIDWWLAEVERQSRP